LIKKAFIAGLLWIAAVLPGFAQDDASNIEFVENKGQWDPRVDFKGEMMVGAFFLQKKGFTVLLHNADELARMSGAHHGMLGPVPGGETGGGGVAKGQKAAASTAMAPTTAGGPPGGIPGDVLIHSHAYTVSFLGANPDVVVIPDKPLPSYNNYFIGHDPSKWASHCRIFQGVTYKNIYPNIDVRYYSDKGQLKYDIIVHPGGDVNQIALRYEGADKLSTKKGQLIVGTSVGEVKELAPYSYLFNERGKTEIDSKFTGLPDSSFWCMAMWTMKRAGAAPWPRLGSNARSTWSSARSARHSAPTARTRARAPRSSNCSSTRRAR